GGFASGVMTVTAGVGGPGLVVYALATQWEHRGFAATAQLHFAVLGAAALVAKWSLPTLPVAGWALPLVMMVVGLLGGNVLARRGARARSGRGGVGGKGARPSGTGGGGAARPGVVVVGPLGGNVLARWVHGARAVGWVIVVAMAGALPSLTQGFVQL